MRMNAMIPLMGQQIDPVGAYTRGRDAREQMAQYQQAEQLRNVFAEQGAGIMAGDQNALAALAGIDPAAALGIRGDLQSMEIQRNDDRRADQRIGIAQEELAMRRQQVAMQAQEHAARMSAAERAEALEEIDRALAGGTQIQDPETWDRYMSENGMDEYVGAFEERDQLIAEALGLRDALSMSAGPSPQSPLGKLEADFRRGLVSPEAYQAEIQSIGRPGVEINNMGSIPPGYQVQYDDAGRPLSMAPIAGSPAEREAAAAESAAENARSGQVRAADIVLEDIGRIQDIVKDAPFYNPAVGFGSGLAGRVEGSNATNVRELAGTIRANIGFDRLQQMREASPTGGALGQVTERELARLEAVLGSLEQSQSEGQFLQNLGRLTGIYNEIIHGPGGAPAEEDDSIEAIINRYR